MRSRYHLPVSIIFPEEVSAEERARLQRVVLSAIRRAIENVAGERAEIIVAPLENEEEARKHSSLSPYDPSQNQEN